MSELAPYYVMNVHQDGMTAAWSLLLNLGIIAGALRYYKLALITHIVSEIIVLILTYTFILYVLVPYGFNVNNPSDWTLYAHGIVGCMLLGFSVFQTVGGLLIYLGRKSKRWDIEHLKTLRKIHMFFGFFLALIYKFINLYAWRFTIQFMYVLVIWEGVTIIAYIFIKFNTKKF